VFCSKQAIVERNAARITSYEHMGSVLQCVAVWCNVVQCGAG